MWRDSPMIARPQASAKTVSDRAARLGLAAGLGLALLLAAAPIVRAAPADETSAAGAQAVAGAPVLQRYLETGDAVPHSARRAACPARAAMTPVSAAEAVTRARAAAKAGAPGRIDWKKFLQDQKSDDGNQDYVVGEMLC